MFNNLFNVLLGDKLKFVFSPDVILCGWLGWKHQTTNWLLRLPTPTPNHQQDKKTYFCRVNTKRVTMKLYFWKQLRQAVTKSLVKSFLRRSTSQVLLDEVACRGDLSGLHGTSYWLASLWRHGTVAGHCVRRDSTDMQKVEKERASLIENEVEVSTTSVRASASQVVWGNLMKAMKHCRLWNALSVTSLRALQFRKPGADTHLQSANSPYSIVWVARSARWEREHDCRTPLRFQKYSAIVPAGNSFSSNRNTAKHQTSHKYDILEIINKLTNKQKPHTKKQHVNLLVS